MELILIVTGCTVTPRKKEKVFIIGPLLEIAYFSLSLHRAGQCPIGHCPLGHSPNVAFGRWPHTQNNAVF
jgi:hypothetical protein